MLIRGFRRFVWLLGVTASAAGLAAPAAAQAPAAVEGDPTRGAEFYKSICLECHGEVAAGIREMSSPSLHQQEDWYLLGQLEKFRAGTRGTAEGDSTGAEMRAKALLLPDDQAMSDVVAYIKTLKGPGPAPATLTGNAEAGAALYGTTCIACHGADGKGMAVLKSPSLIGQSDWYLQAQLAKFRAGQRGYDPTDVNGLQMKAMSATLANEQAVLDVATYVRSLY
ncbi:MAG: cytochrome c [Gemmatimonadota bacterium]|nr:MAG: cytochrome c [Gemmatimonadota bacterium]